MAATHRVKSDNRGLLAFVLVVAAALRETTQRGPLPPLLKDLPSIRDRLPELVQTLVEQPHTQPLSEDETRLLRVLVDRLDDLLEAGVEIPVTGPLSKN